MAPVSYPIAQGVTVTLPLAPAENPLVPAENPPAPPENPPMPAENPFQAATLEPHVPGHLPEDVEVDVGAEDEVIQLVVNGPVQGTSPLLRSLFGFPLEG